MNNKQENYIKSGPLLRHRCYTNMSNLVGHVCDDCGIMANTLTCLKKYCRPPKQNKVSSSTYIEGICDFCGDKKNITQVRDFYYPDFELLCDFLESVKTQNKMLEMRN